jgi:hypothetical protein
MPPGSDKQTILEGKTDENPICFGAPFTVAKFDNLLTWFYR